MSLRNQLLGEHCGASARDVADALAEDPSLVKLVDKLSRDGRRLEPIDDGVPDRSPLSRLAERVADPRRPLRLSRLVGHAVPRLLALRQTRGSSGNSHAGLLVPIGIVLGLVALTLAWRYTALSDFADPKRVQALLGDTVTSPLAPFAVIACFIVGGLVAFPVVILILVTAAIFGPWLGFAYAAAGAAASACVFYVAGARLGSEHLRRLAGDRWGRLRGWLQRRGLLAVVALRVVPMAPFTLVNLAVGASGIRFVDFAVGTLIGMGPGLVAMSFLGSRLADVIANPSFARLALLGLAAVAWAGIAFGAQALVSRLAGHAQQGTS